jgi:hypothetical protein
VNLVEGDRLGACRRVHSNWNIDQRQFQKAFPCGSQALPP